MRREKIHKQAGTGARKKKTRITAEARKPGAEGESATERK